MKLIRVHYHTESEKYLMADLSEFHPDILLLFAELGIIEIKDNAICSDDFKKLNRIRRLKDNCGVNTIGATIIVDLLDKIEKLQDELENLRER